MKVSEFMATFSSNSGTRSVVVVDTFAMRRRLEAKRDRINAKIAELLKEREAVTDELLEVR